MKTIDFQQLKEKVNKALANKSHPFEELEAYNHPEKPDQAFIDKWINPFYMEVNNLKESEIQKLEKLVPEINDDVILRCLGDYNWRTRKMGAYFAAIKNKIEFIDIIGVHLLKSELTYAGNTYALALSAFNNERGNQYLTIYLDYYLKRTDLYFDQSAVITALKYLDEVNCTTHFENYIEAWKEFVSSASNRMDEIPNNYIKPGIRVIESLRAI